MEFEISNHTRKKTIQAMQKNNVVLCFLNYIIEGQSNNLYHEKVYQNLGGSAQKKRIKKYEDLNTR